MAAPAAVVAVPALDHVALSAALYPPRRLRRRLRTAPATRGALSVRFAFFMPEEDH